MFRKANNKSKYYKKELSNGISNWREVGNLKKKYYKVPYYKKRSRGNPGVMS